MEQTFKVPPLELHAVHQTDPVSYSSNKLSLATPPVNGSASNSEHPTRNYSLSKRFGGDTSSHGNKPNPFNAASPGAVSSPTAGASSAFGLGSGAFASFGASKAPKSPGNALDFGGVTAGKTLSEKTSKEGSLNKTAKKTTPPPVHKLRDGWVFWFRPPISKSNGYQEYEKTLHPMAGFSNVEDFFTVYKHLKRPSTLPLVSDYHLFKDGIRPVWEDEENKKGGKWIVRLKKGVADRYWEDLLFAVIGDQFAEASDEVCGVVLSVRNGEDMLSIWTRSDDGRVLRIRETMKRVLGFPPDTKVEWKSHDSSIAQRTAIDEQRKEKVQQRNGREEQGDKKAVA